MCVSSQNARVLDPLEPDRPILTQKPRPCGEPWAVRTLLSIATMPADWNLGDPRIRFSHLGEPQWRAWRQTCLWLEPHNEANGMRTRTETHARTQEMSTSIRRTEQSERR